MGAIQQRFTGSDRCQAKRAALAYWAAHRDRLQLTLREFNDRCVMLGDGSTILFLRTVPGKVSKS